MWILRVLDQSRRNLTPGQTKCADDGRVDSESRFTDSLGQLEVAPTVYLIA